MAKVWLSEKLSLKDERIWTACNGATRRRLVVVNKLGPIGENINFVEAQLGFLNKGNHSFIFINPPRKDDDRTLGLFRGMTSLSHFKADGLCPSAFCILYA